ncbi:MAG: hypothetical protein KatS3mg035_1531 [Bacteroidia bacterium]|nr:MAG: hypothetical protein KatS3mg035_1531 [Bacteroidia bacterium]
MIKSKKDKLGTNFFVKVTENIQGTECQESLLYDKQKQPEGQIPPSFENPGD